MAPHFTAILGVLTFFLAVSRVDATLSRGLGWATPNRYGSDIGHKPLMKWYYHWELGPVQEIDLEFVPMCWGPNKWSEWKARVSEMEKKTPTHILTFNEPEVSSQANMDPNYATQVYMEEIYPWAAKGVLLGSPAIVWNIEWMDAFLNAVRKKGGHVDFLCIHWYGSYADMTGFQKFVETVHSRFGKKIWITEVGITEASKPSQSQVKSFMMNAISWLESQSYVERVAWFGCWESNNPPDDYSSPYNALLRPGGALDDMGFWYAYTKYPDKRSIRARYRDLARNVTVNDGAIHCDDFCELRKRQLDSSPSISP